MEGRLTGNVLREELGADLLSFGAAVGIGVPEDGDEVVSVVSGCDFHVFHRCGADVCSICQNVDVEVRYCSGVFRRIREVDQGRDSKTGQRGVRNGQIADLDVNRTRDVLITVAGLVAVADRCMPKVSQL
jgi:hypothetical protein